MYLFYHCKKTLYMLRISKDEAEEVFELMKDPVTGEWISAGGE